MRYVTSVVEDFLATVLAPHCSMALWSNAVLKKNNEKQKA
jgi:hypothetical protein